MNQKEIDVAEVLSGSEGVAWDNSVKIAEATYGDINAAMNAAILLRRGWTINEVLESLKRR